MSTIELTGLKGHHPLGFLAACGLLRCCAGADELRMVKLAWGSAHGASGFIARLHFDQQHSDSNAIKERIIAQLIFSADRASQADAFAWSKKIRVGPDKYCEAARKAIGECRHDDIAFLVSYASDLVMSKKGKLVATAFDMTSARQAFLGLRKIIAASLGADGKPLPLKAEVLPVESQSPLPREAFEEALCGPWQYCDNVHSHGLDPATQRLHALLEINPNVGREKQGIPGVRAAVFLASQALPLFPCFAVRGQLRTTGFHRDKADDWFAWPIWRDPISLHTLRSLLSHPFDNDLRRRGVEVMYRCRRVKTGGAKGKYQVFSHPELRPWPPARRPNRPRPAEKVQ